MIATKVLVCKVLNCKHVIMKVNLSVNYQVCVEEVYCVCSSDQVFHCVQDLGETADQL